MDKTYFIKQNHKNVAVAFSSCYVCLLIIVMIIILKNSYYHWGYVIFLLIVLLGFICLYRLLRSYGIYINGENIYYKQIKKRKINISEITAIKIIKAEGQVNIAWSPFTMRDNKGNILYSMICLSELKDEMQNYSYGDLEFIRKYKKYIIFYTVYDDILLNYLKQHKSDIKILDFQK